MFDKKNELFSESCDAQQTLRYSRQLPCLTFANRKGNPATTMHILRHKEMDAAPCGTLQCCACHTERGAFTAPTCSRQSHLVRAVRGNHYLQGSVYAAISDGTSLRPPGKIWHTGQRQLRLNAIVAESYLTCRLLTWLSSDPTAYPTSVPLRRNGCAYQLRCFAVRNVVGICARYRVGWSWRAIGIGLPKKATQGPPSIPGTWVEASKRRRQ